MGAEEDIQRLGSAIRALKIQYERFFSGALERPPLEQRTQLENLIRSLTQPPPKALVHRFHINTLVSRFNTLAERWARILRNREMGIAPPHLSMGTALRAESQGNLPATSPPSSRKAPTGNGNSRISDPETQQLEIRQLYDKFSRLHQQEYGGPPKLAFEAFATSIRKSAQEIMKKSGCRAVDFLVSVGDNKTIRVKAKPIQ